MGKKKGREVKDEVLFPRNKKEIEQEKARIAQEAAKHTELAARAKKSTKSTKKK